MGWRTSPPTASHAAVHVLVLVLLLSPAVHGWSFAWRNANNDTFIEYGTSDFPCKEIANPLGKLYQYDSEGDPCTIYMYGTTDCTGYPNGRALHYHSKFAGLAINSFRVEDREKLSSSSSSSSSSASSTTGTSATATVTSPMQETSVRDSEVGKKGGSGGISGGGIAGIVVGALAGVALVAALGFFLVRRRRKAAASVAVDPGVSSTTQTQTRSMQDDDDGDAAFEKDPAAVLRRVELAGDTGMAELSDSRQVNELSGSAQVNELEGGERGK
ncbi:hypothetical protein FE257_006974 [Aspergillus nanangensis]|uniref:Uncharacterized protein n=1 Tax=Aspergillus nanangensis TaxID=2582783 RepID=A0AAD4CNP8_ASPNN|nr:hypothetical protein FE257_006974 [Aspergillus nanangensis]